MREERKPLPWWVKQQCLAVVRGYEASRKEYLRMRREILDAGSGNGPVDYIDEKGRKQSTLIPGAHHASRTTENKALRLEALESSQACRQIRAVEHARDRIGEGLPEALRDMLRDGIMLNCMNGRKYNYERLYVTGISRSEFYRFRDTFFRMIAAELGLF